jgi:hypothetical protein
VVGGVNAIGNTTAGRRGCGNEVEEKFFSPAATGVEGEKLFSLRPLGIWLEAVSAVSSVFLVL